MAMLCIYGGECDGCMSCQTRNETYDDFCDYIDKEVLENTKQQVQTESNTYKEMITDAETQIKEYRGMIKNLEELCVAYKTVIENNSVKVAQANKDVVEVLNTLIGRREF